MSQIPSSGPSPAPEENRTPPIVIHHHTGASRLTKVFLWMGWAGCGVLMLILLAQLAMLSDYFDTSGGIYEKHHSGAEFAADKVAVITVDGVIMDGDGFVKDQIDRVADDENVKAVVVRVNSPGGTVTGSDYIYHHLKQLREEKNVPLVVSMGGMAASGGYYLSMAVGDQEESIFAEPTTTTGSIGVIIPHYDLTGLMEQYGVRDQSIKSHPRKQMLSMTREMKAEDREILQEYVDQSFERFKEIVKSGRPEFRKNEAKLDKLATGEIFTATTAQESGLVDQIGFLEDAVARARELAGLSEDSTRVVRYEEPAALIDFGPLAQGARGNVSVADVLNLQAPRAWFLASPFPPLTAARR